MNSHEKYVNQMVELLRVWMKDHVARSGMHTFVVAGNHCFGVEAAVQAVVLRFPPPPWPSRWDRAVPVAVMIAALLILSDHGD